MSAAQEVSPARNDATVIALVGFAHSISHFFHLVIPLLFPWLMPEFGLSYTQAGALMTVFFVFSGFGQALAGLWVDRSGSRPVLYCGVLFLAVSGLLLGVAHDYLLLMGAAAMAGAGNAVFHPADFTLLNRRVSRQRLGHAFSVHGLSGNLGWAAAPLLMTGVASAAGWRVAAFVAAALAVLSLLFLYALRRLLDDARRDAGEKTASASPVLTLAVLRSPAVLLCFVFFFFVTAAFGGLQNFSAAALKAVYGLLLTRAASCLSAYLLGGAAGIAAGGFLAQRRAQDTIIAVCLCFGAAVSVLLSTGAVPAWGNMPLMAAMGFGVSIAGPSRDLLVRRAATQGLGEASFGRVYGFVYSGLDIGLATAPMLFGPILDGGRFGALWLGIAVFQIIAVFSALRVGRGVAH